MTTSNSPLRRLRAQADAMAANLKAWERGELPVDPTGKIAAARANEAIKFVIAMDDKVLSIELSWITIRDTSEEGISEYIILQMQGKGDAKGN